MKLIFLYGPPAVGKYTIGKELAKKTDYILFHSHVVVDVVRYILDFNNESFWGLVYQIRLLLFRQALKENLPGMIFTFVYEKGIDDAFIKKVIKMMTSKGGQIIFVQLICDKKDLFKRVLAQSRKQFHKVNTRKGLTEIFKKFRDINSEIPFVKSTVINNTNLSIKETANQVLQLMQ